MRIGDTDDADLLEYGHATTVWIVTYMGVDGGLSVSFCRRVMMNLCASVEFIGTSGELTESIHNSQLIQAASQVIDLIDFLIPMITAVILISSVQSHGRHFHEGRKVTEP